MKQLRIKKLFADAKLPTYGTDGAAAFDLYAQRIESASSESLSGESAELFGSDDFVVFGTGLSFEIPEGHAMFIYSRSGHGFKHTVRLVNATGIIDSDYRGEVMVKLIKDNWRHSDVILSVGDRIAQAVILPVERYEMVAVEELTETTRGTGGFGSTGA